MTRSAARADEASHPSGAFCDAEICPALGAPCPAAARLATRLAAAVVAARAVAGPAFGFDGRAVIDGCATGCDAHVTAGVDGIRIDCESGVTVSRPAAPLH